MAATKSTAKKEKPAHLKPFTTDADLKNRKPQPARYEIGDAGCPGLRVRIEPTGTKKFVWYARDENRKRHIIPLGLYGDVSLAQARKTLDGKKAQLEDGSLFNTTKRVPKTVNELAEVFYNERIIPKRKRPDAVRQILDHDILPLIGTRKILMITPIDISDIVLKVVKRGATTHAGKVLSIAKQMFKFATSRGYLEGQVSPAYSHTPDDLGVVNNVRDRHLDADEVAAFWKAVNDAPRMSDPVRAAFRILLLSGVRSGELRLTKWEHVNFDEKTWFIPAKNTKTNTGWCVPLSSHLIAQFRALQGLSGGSEWVFAGLSDGPFTDKVLGRSMRRLFHQGLLDIPAASPHDLRRTMRTGLSKLKIDHVVAERCLNHSLGKITETYVRDEMIDERRDALEAWGDYVDLIVTPRENVKRLQA